LVRVQPRNPAAILLAPVLAGDVEVRVLEALPWLAVPLSQSWLEKLVRQAKVRDVQTGANSSSCWRGGWRRSVGISWPRASFTRWRRFSSALALSARTRCAKNLSQTQNVAGFARRVPLKPEKTTLTQGIWEVRIDSVLKLDRAAKRETSDENQQGRWPR